MRRSIQEHVLDYGRRNFRPFPWRADASPWRALTAEVLLQRTRAEQVIPIYHEFGARYPAPEFLVRETPEGLLSVIGTLGLRWRAPLMLQMAKAVQDRGGVPDSYEDLVAMPGIGPYAAAAYLSLHREIRAVIIDSNIVRWLGRVFGFPTDGETRRKPWLRELADDLTPRRAFRDYNYAVLDFTMNVCRPRPRCEICPLAPRICRYFTLRDAKASGVASRAPRSRTRRS